MTRKALGERNGSNDTLFSSTTVSGFGGSQQSLHSQPDISLASVGGYNDFAVSIPHNSTRREVTFQVPHHHDGVVGTGPSAPSAESSH